MNALPKGAARAVADLAAGIILASVEIDAPVERVFAAISTGEVAEWWGSPETYRVTRWTADLRPGGAWRSEGVGSDGKPFTVSGEILAVKPPRLLVHTWKYDWDAKAVTTLRYAVDPTPTGSRVTVRHEGFQSNPKDCEDHAQGWERVLAWLAGYVERKRSNP